MVGFRIRRHRSNSIQTEKRKRNYGTREDKKAGGDAEAAARESGHADKGLAQRAVSFSNCQRTR